MGKFVLHEWAALLAMVSATYTIWGGLWGIFYRKFFWDMMGGTLGPAGLIPAKAAMPFVVLIVDLPVLQILNIVAGLFTLALEWPIPALRDSALGRSLGFKVVWYFWCGFLALLPYQTFDAGVYYLITSAVFVQSIRNGEMMDSAKSQKGSVGIA